MQSRVAILCNETNGEKPGSDKANQISGRSVGADDLSAFIIYLSSPLLKSTGNTFLHMQTFICTIPYL